MGGHVFGKGSKVLAGTLAVGCATFGLGVLRAAPTAAAEQGTVPAHEDTYAVAPTITALNDTFGPAAGGNPVTITGTGLATATSVDFAAVSIPLSDFTCTATSCRVHHVPAGTGGTTVYVTVTTPDGTSNAVTYAYQATADGPPTVTGMSSHVGPPEGGNQIAIFGTNLADLTAIQFGAAVVPPNAYVCDTVATSCTVTVPAGLSGQTVDVIVTNSFGTSSTSVDGRYTYRPDSPPAPPVPHRPVGPFGGNHGGNNGNGNSDRPRNPDRDVTDSHAG